jgi:hypothetical protein
LKGNEILLVVGPEEDFEDLDEEGLDFCFGEGFSELCVG